MSGAFPPPATGETKAQAGREAEIRVAQVKAGHACSGMLFGSDSLGVSLSLGCGSMNQPQRHLGQSHPFPTGGHLCPFVPGNGAPKLSSVSLLSPLWAGAQGWPYAGGGSEREEPQVNIIRHRNKIGGPSTVKWGARPFLHHAQDESPCTPAPALSPKKPDMPVRWVVTGHIWAHICSVARLTGHAVDGFEGPQDSHGADGRQVDVLQVQGILDHSAERWRDEGRGLEGACSLVGDALMGVV